MIRTLLISFVIAGVSAAHAATYALSLVQPVVVNGQSLKAGDYSLNVTDGSIVIVKGKKRFEVVAKVEETQQKFDRTLVLYREGKGEFSIQEIDLGGTATKLTFDSGIKQ